MRSVTIRRTLAVVLSCALIFFLFPVSSSGEENRTVYMENEWNYVDQSMDVSRGIPADASGRLEKIRQAGKLTIATEPYFPPQEFIDPGLTGQESFVGSDMELAKLIAERMGVELELVPLDFTDVLPAVAEGRCDLAISALSYTPGRAAMTELSKGYYDSDENDSSQLLIRGKDSGRITGTEDLAGKNIVAQSGSVQEMLMAENVHRYREFRRVSQLQEVYDLIRRGKMDAGMVNREAAEDFIRANPRSGLVLVPGLFFRQEDQFRGDRIAARKGETELIAFVNGVIDELLDSGRYQEWYREYEEYAKRLGI